MEKFTKLQDEVNKLPPLTEHNKKRQRPSQQYNLTAEMFRKTGAKVRVNSLSNLSDKNKKNT